MQSFLSTLILLLASTTAAYLLPNPPGKYNVTLATGPLVDYKRNDPYAAVPTPRTLMLSIFQPAKCASTVSVPYMPNRTAEYQGSYLQKGFNVSADFTPLFLEARLPVCPSQPSSCSSPKNYPILLLSPGWAVPRLYYSVLASAIASEGFIVITIDHPEDANIITYPDGHAVYNNLSVWDAEATGIDVRAADASFIIDQLSNATAIAELLPERGVRPFPIDRVAMLGHSLGGATSIIAASRDPRIRGVIDWDGTIFGSLPPSGIYQPVLLVSEAGATDSSWLKDWPQLKGPKLWITVANSTHQTYSDIPMLLQAAGQNSMAFEELLGSIAPAEMVRILASTTATWMTGAFTGNEKILQGLDKFPEVSITMKENL